MATPSLFLDTLSGKPGARMPFWFMRQAGRYLPEYKAVRASCDGFLDLCYTPEKAIEVTLQPIRRFGFDASILFSDILVIPHALGQGVRFVEGEGPKLDAITSPEAIPHLDLAALHAHLAPVYETVSGIRAALPKETALIGFAGSPWTLAAYMIEGGGSKDFAKARRFALEHPAAFRGLLQTLVNAISEYLIRQVQSGADALQLFDSWAGLLSAAEFDSYVIEPTRAIVQAVRLAHPDVPIIGFPRLAGPGYAAYARQTGVTAIGIDAQWRPEAIADRLAPLAVTQGNLDNQLLAHDLQASLAYIDRLDQAMDGLPHVFNLGHGILPHTPIAHVEVVCNRLRGE